jgi:uncharacterized protein
MRPYKPRSVSLRDFAAMTLKSTAKNLIRLYQYALSPFLGGRCRFYPSCSDYALECFDKHNVVRATSLISQRLLRCHPFGRHGFDPVPEVK